MSLTFLLSLFLLEYSKSPSDSLTRIFLANTQTMLKQATVSFHGLSSPSVNTSWQRTGRGSPEPHDTLYSPKMPEWSSPFSFETASPSAGEGKYVDSET